MKFIDYFPQTVFQTFKDRPDANGYAMVTTKEDPDLFDKLNLGGCGIYFTPNGFSATEQEKDELWEKRKEIKADASRPTERNGEFLRSINAVYADLDLGKEGDVVTDVAKSDLVKEVCTKFKPNFIIWTKNGIQPIWLVDCNKIDQETQNLFKKVVNGIIEWSKTVGAKGDHVKDLTRVLRLPPYYHMKGKAYSVQLLKFCTEKTTLRKLESVFPFEEKEVYKPTQKPTAYLNNPVSEAMDRLNFQDVIVAAFKSVGRSAEFDRQKRLILDGRLTGTHQGKTGDGDFLASSSHEPFKGNRITAVADILGVTNKQARKWIVETFNLDYDKLKSKKRVEKIEEKIKEVEVKKRVNYYSWGTKELTENFAPIKDNTFAVVGAGYGTGKTTFCLNMALENVKLGHNVLYLSLEMDNEEILDYLSRKSAAITIAEEIYKEIPEGKENAYLKRREELESIEGLTIKGVRGGTDINWGMLVELMKGDYDLIFVDNFNCVQADDGISQYEHEGMLSKRFLGYTQDVKTPLVVVHHYSKGGAREDKKSGYSLSGNARIMNDAHRIILLERKHKAKSQGFDFDEIESEPTAKEKAMMVVKLDKGRGYDDGVFKMIYFYKGIFLDEYPELETVSWKDI